MDLGAALLAEAVNGKTLYLLVGLVVGGGLLRVLAPEERGRLRGLVLILGLCLLLLPAVAALRAGGDPAYPQVVAALVLLEALAVVGLAAGFLFAVLLPRLGFHAPRILRDVLVAAAAVVTFFVVASRSGFNVSGLIATSTVLTAVIGLSLQDTSSATASTRTSSRMCCARDPTWPVASRRSWPSGPWASRRPGTRWTRRRTTVASTKPPTTCCSAYATSSG